MICSVMTHIIVGKRIFTLSVFRRLLGRGDTVFLLLGLPVAKLKS